MIHLHRYVCFCSNWIIRFHAIPCCLCALAQAELFYKALGATLSPVRQRTKMHKDSPQCEKVTEELPRFAQPETMWT